MGESLPHSCFLEEETALGTRDLAEVAPLVRGQGPVSPTCLPGPRRALGHRDEQSQAGPWGLPASGGGLTGGGWEGCQGRLPEEEPGSLWVKEGRWERDSGGGKGILCQGQVVRERKAYASVARKGVQIETGQS